MYVDVTLIHVQLCCDVHTGICLGWKTAFTLDSFAPSFFLSFFFFVCVRTGWPQVGLRVCHVHPSLLQVQICLSLLISQICLAQLY